jgi:hypothetical protein
MLLADSQLPTKSTKSTPNYAESSLETEFVGCHDLSYERHVLASAHTKFASRSIVEYIN